MNEKNAYFKLQIQSNGTYLQLFDGDSKEKKVTAEEIIQYFDRICFTDYDINDLKVKLKSVDSNGMIKITDNRIRPVRECLTCEINEAADQAVVKFYAPSDEGSRMTKEEILDALHHSQIKYGIDNKLINEWVLNRIYNKEFVIARAKDPVQGTNGRVIYCFNTNAIAQPRLNMDGTVDYHHLDYIEHIKKGERLAYIEQAKDGAAGMLVTGVPVTPVKTKTPRFKYGRNITVSEDGTSMYSEVDGHAYLVEDKVFVSNIYEVEADVDASTGDIEFNGDIHVKGSVRSGFTLKATGQIYVEGVVEGAMLEAEGPIIIKGGIQGMSKATINSKSNITVKFIENATVNAGGNVVTEAIMHSDVSANGKISVEGKKGLLVGGEIHAGECVKVKVAGSPMGAFTTIEVGISKDTLKECRRIEELIPKQEAELNQLKQILSAYRIKLTKGIKLNPKQIDTVKTMAARIKELERTIPHLIDELEELTEEMQKSLLGRVVVEEKIYPRVKLDISSAILIIKEKTQNCTFVKEGVDVKSITL